MKIRSILSLTPSTMTSIGYAVNPNCRLCEGRGWVVDQYGMERNCPRCDS